ncbi:tyrosine-type recombinase/integrase [Octadecabacter sp.]|nr:tyrosine-type recombinase/integrase [Octadecabacter sp.]
MSSKSQDKLPKYVFRTAFGVFRFKRNVPKDIREVSGKVFFYKVLGKDYKDAMRAYSTALLEFDRFVATYRNEAPVRDAALAIVSSEYGEEAMLQLARGQVDENLDFALMDLSDKVEGKVSKEVQAVIHSGVLPEAPLSIAECIDRHYTYKKSGIEDKDRLVRNLGERAKTYLTEALGRQAVYETPVETLTRKDSNRYRDLLLSKMKPNSVKRLLGHTATALNFCIKEDDLNTRNPFQGVIIKGAGATKDDRLPLSKEDLYELNNAFDAPDDVAALWTTLRDTGARLSEIVYLAVGDVDLQDKAVAIRPNAFRGTLKTASSERTIPLSDKALDALQVLRQGKEDDEAIFTRYARPRGADSASQMLMKRLRKVVKDPKKSIHSLRHSMKDNLRNSGCPEELAKSLLGHSDGSVASRYGSGYTLDVLRQAMEKAWS